MSKIVRFFFRISIKVACYQYAVIFSLTYAPQYRLLKSETYLLQQGHTSFSGDRYVNPQMVEIPFNTSLKSNFNQTKFLVSLSEVNFVMLQYSDISFFRKNAIPPEFLHAAGCLSRNKVTGSANPLIENFHFDQPTFLQNK